MEIIKKNICIENFKCKIYTEEDNKWGVITGMTSGDTIEYYYETGDTLYNSSVGFIPILFTSNYDDIGIVKDYYEEVKENKTYYFGDVIIYKDKSYKCVVESTTELPITTLLTESDDDLLMEDGVESLMESEYYSLTEDDYYTLMENDEYSLMEGAIKWVLTNEQSGSLRTINFKGESRIDEFARYGKNSEDPDLYNPTWNVSYQQKIIDVNNNLKQITYERFDNNNQNLYDYIIGADPNDIENTGFKYSDIGNGFSNIEYKVRDLNEINTITTPTIKINYLLGVSEPPKINSNIFIDRFINSSFDKHLKLSEVKTTTDLINYGNNYFKIKEN